MEKNIKLGAIFASYEEFLETLKKYCDKEYVSFFKREARTIAAAKKKTERYINPKLKYQLKYTCIKGGKKFKSLGTAKRNTSTYKEGCNAHITLRASQCGNKLQIISLDETHSHLISKQLYDHLPQQRRLPEDIQSEILHLAKLKTKRKQIKCYIEEKCNKIVLLKNIHNMASKSTKCNGEKTPLQSSIEKLQNKYGADCHILCDEENNFKALFFQTKVMKHYISVYPEFICIDTTFKLLDIRTPVLIVINEDGNGLSEIVAVGILVEENTDTMQWFFSKFKENNPKWVDVKSIMADKDLNERRLLKENFPNANVLICIFHAMRTFNREISTNKLGITLTQRQTALKILQKMVYAREPTTYSALYEDLLKSCPLAVIEYFNKNWHDIKDEWTLGPKFQQSNFLNTTNNRLESLNAKIKSIVERYSTLTSFIDDFFKLVMIMNDERDHKAANFIYKVPVCFYEKDSVLYNYLMFLTTYAFNFVKKQFLSRNICSNSEYETTNESCNCGSHTSMLLPCRHIFKKREELSMNMYEESLCHARWTRKHYCSTQRLFLTDNSSSLANRNYFPQQPPIISRSVTKSTVTLNQHQKFNKAWMLLKSLASLISEEGNARYHAKLRQLIQLKTAWENDKDVTIAELDKQAENHNISENDTNAALEAVLEDQVFINQDNVILDNCDIEIIDDVPVVEDNASILISEQMDSNAVIVTPKIIDDVPVVEDNASILISEQMNSNAVIVTPKIIEDVPVIEDNASILTSEEMDSNAVIVTPSVDNTLLNVTNVILPTAAKKRGRPKGRNSTVIGLPTKKGKSSKKRRADTT